MVHQDNKYRSITVTVLIVFGMVFTATACAAASADPGISPAALQMTEDSLRLQAHQTSTAEKASFVQQQTALAQTLAAVPTPTLPPIVTATPFPTLLPDIRSTQLYEEMKAKTDQYIKDGYLPSGTSSYYRLPDYHSSWAQIEWYQWDTIDYQPTNFAIESDIQWSSASTTANWPDSGCGYVFHASDTENHYRIYLGLDGYVYLSSYKKGEGFLMSHAYYGKLEVPDGKAHIALLVNGDKFTFFVNDKLTLKVNGFKDALLNGSLAYVLVSGTNKGFGTSCSFTNTNLWAVNP